MDFRKDIIIEKLYKDYIKVCSDYEQGFINNDEAISKIKTIQESLGVYISGVFELKRRKEGGE